MYYQHLQQSVLTVGRRNTIRCYFDTIDVSIIIAINLLR